MSISPAIWRRVSPLSEPGLAQFTGRLQFATNGKRLYDITARLAEWVSAQRISTGLLTVFVQHTSASLTVQENSDPAVQEDLNAFFDRLVQEDHRFYGHTIEGPDDMPAHIRAALTLTQISIPVVNGRMALGVWQAVYLFEHRAHPQTRSVVLHLLGEA